MPEPVITKKIIIVVDDVGENSYKDMVFKDKEGNSYKINEKRVQYFKDKIIKGMGVKLNYAMSSFGKEYIYSAESVKDNLPPPTQPQKMTPTKPPDMPPQNVQSISSPVKPLDHSGTPSLTKIAQEMNKMLGADEIKLRSMAVSYAKDAWIAGKTDAENVFHVADKFLAYIKGQ